MRLQFQSARASAVAVVTMSLFLAQLSLCAFATESSTDQTAAWASVSQIDPASAVRGSPGVSLENLGLSNDFGKLAFLLNAGFVLLFGLLAVIVGRHRPKRMRSPVSAAERSGVLANLGTK
jgi:hypothetical protein